MLGGALARVSLEIMAIGSFSKAPVLWRLVERVAELLCASLEKLVMRALVRQHRGILRPLRSELVQPTFAKKVSIGYLCARQWGLSKTG